MAPARIEFLLGKTPSGNKAIIAELAQLEVTGA